MSKLKRLKDVSVGVVLGGMLFSGVSYAASATNIEVFFQPLKYFFDGIEKKAPQDQQGFVYKGTTYVPLRFVSESLGKKVGYEGKTSSIYVGKQLEGQKTYLEDLRTFTKSGNGSFEHNFKSNTGDSYSHALLYTRATNMFYTQETNVIEYLLNGNYKKFDALIVPSDYWNELGKKDDIGNLKIYADDKLVYESGAIASDITQPVKVSVDLTGVLKIKIIFDGKLELGLVDAGFIS